VLQRLDVRAQARDRGAQLVARVRDELALGVHRALERVERGVEASREAAELVTPGGVDPLRGVRRLGELLGTAREAPDRGQRGACHEGGQRAAERDPRRAHDQEHEQHAIELAVDLVEWPRHLDRAALGERPGQNSQMSAPGRGIGEELARAGPRDLAGTIVRGEGVVGARPPDHVPRGKHQLDVSRGTAERLRPRRREHAPLAGWQSSAEAIARSHAERTLVRADERDPLRALSQRVVHLLAELAPHGDVDRNRGDHHHERDRQGRGARYARPQAHGSRRA
jgi:hypothetical protein